MAPLFLLVGVLLQALITVDAFFAYCPFMLPSTETPGIILWMTSGQKKENHQKRSKSKSATNANDMALKIGLTVVAPTAKPTKEHISDNGRVTKAKTKKKQKTKGPKDNTTTPMTIAWGPSLENLFWPPQSDQTSNDNNSQLRRIPNRENFPLIHVPEILSGKSLALALAMTKGDSRDLEEMEQHEKLQRGMVHTLRRSLVSQLTNNDLLLEEVLGRVPMEIIDDQKNHPFEDGSVVYYRPGDFYEEHHDSCDYNTAAGKIITVAHVHQSRKRQRAFTVLLYLKTPTGDSRIGGTEFTRLTPLYNTIKETKHRDDKNQTSDHKSNTGLIIKPKAGDALIWPNFDRRGNPCIESLHRALPIGDTGAKHESASGGGSDKIEKIVVNLWFEGFAKTDQ